MDTIRHGATALSSSRVKLGGFGSGQTWNWLAAAPFPLHHNPSVARKAIGSYRKERATHDAMAPLGDVAAR